MSGLLFLVAIDWVMKKVDRTTRSKGIDWSGLRKLDDLDFADDIALLASTKRGIQMRGEKLEEIAKVVGLHINYTKTKAMTIGTNTPESIEINQQCSPWYFKQFCTRSI